MVWLAFTAIALVTPTWGVSSFSETGITSDGKTPSYFTDNMLLPVITLQTSDPTELPLDDLYKYFIVFYGQQIEGKN